MYTTDILKNIGYFEKSASRSDSDIYLSDFIFYEYDDEGNQIANPTKSDDYLLERLIEVKLPNDDYMPWVIAQSHNQFYPVFGQPVTFVIKPAGNEGSEEIESGVASYNHSDYSLAAHVYYFADTDDIKFKAMENPGNIFERAVVTEGNKYFSGWTENSPEFGFTMGAFPVTIELWYGSVVNVAVSKIWDDAENIDSIRPSSLSVSLALNNAILTDTDGNPATFLLTPDADGLWQHTFTLPAGDYSNLEIWEGSIDGYYRERTSVMTTDDGVSATVINKHVHVAATATATNESMVDINYKVEKTWDDTKAAGTINHPEITVRLYADGAFLTEKKITAPSLTCTFEDLPKYNDNEGEELISYTITEEINDPDWVKVEEAGETYWYNVNGLGKYKATVMNATITATTTHDSTVDGSITNEYDLLQTKVDVAVTKLWKDHTNENAIRPASIKLGLFKTATDADPVATVNLTGDSDAASWSGKFTDLPLYDGATRIDYSTYVVKEWDPATNTWMNSGDSMVVTDNGNEYVYDFNVE